MRSFEQLLLWKEEFHYLNVTRVGIFTLHDLLDCTFRCLKNVLCLSINMAAFKGADGKLLCELLSSDKYRDSANYQENMSSLHLFIQVGTYLSNTKTACSFIQLFFRNSLVLQIIFFFIQVSLFFFAMSKRRNLHPEFQIQFLRLSLWTKFRWRILRER